MQFKRSADWRNRRQMTLNMLLLPIRRAFDQFANVRPAILYQGVSSPLAQPGDIDMIVVRENTATSKWPLIKANKHDG